MAINKRQTPMNPQQALEWIRQHCRAPSGTTALSNANRSIQMLQAVVDEREKANKKKPKPKKLSRPQQWAAAIEKMNDGLQDLKALKDEYTDWRDGQPENLQQSALGEKLDCVADCCADDEIENAIGELESLDLPLGFGRD